MEQTCSAAYFLNPYADPTGMPQFWATVETELLMLFDGCGSSTHSSVPGLHFKKL